MARKYIFADEAGDFEFSRKPNVSRYFVVCTIILDACDVGHSLLTLRRELAWRKMPLGDYFHATSDKQAVRDEVFAAICAHDFQIQATIMEKSKAQPHVRITKERFYQYGWYYHFSHGMNPHFEPPFWLDPADEPPPVELLITAASVGTKKGQGLFTSAVNDVVQQTLRRNQWATSFCPSAADPCLQVVDYCTWAIQRKWERQKTQAYDLIKDRITYEYELWERGKTHYY